MAVADLATKKFGLGLRRPYFDSILQQHGNVDFLEIISENFMDFGGRPRAALEQAAALFPIVLHGVSLSIGSPDALDWDYLCKLKNLLRFVRAPWVSDHLCLASAHGVQYHELLPLPFTREVVAHVAERARCVQDYLEVPLLLENPTYYLQFPGEMSEAEFINSVLDAANCGLLLDINNVYVNSRNHGYNPRTFLDQMPFHRVLQMHLAGHDVQAQRIVDTHGAAVSHDVLELYRYATGKVDSVWTLLERDHHLPPLSELLEEIKTIRELAHA